MIGWRNLEPKGQRDSDGKKSMDIWEILGIKPTIDKKSIKKAYAARTKVTHPEENPEAFKQLYEAYQTALAYADSFRERTQTGVGREPADDGERGRAPKEDENGPKAELLSYFTDYQEKHRQKVNAFIGYWKAFTGLYRNPEAEAWWKDYLASEAFQDIKDHPRVLQELLRIDHKFFYGLNEVKVLFWDAYGFQEGDEENYQGEKQMLRRNLYLAYAKQQENTKSKTRQEKNEKILRISIGVLSAFILLFCILYPAIVRQQRENERLFLIAYMAGEYPDTTFSEPEHLKMLNSGGIVYSMRSASHPELSVSASVGYQYIEGKRNYLVEEDYRQLLLEHYADQYGLECARVIKYEYETSQGGMAYDVWFSQADCEDEQYHEATEYSVLLYPDIGEIDTFCERAVRMFREQEELDGISAVALCPEKIVYPAVLFQGGVEHRPFSDPQIYDLRHIDAVSLASAAREAYVRYMFQYEPWNITAEQYKQWGAEYERYCEEWTDDQGEWHEVYDPDTGEYLCRAYVTTYEYVEDHEEPGTPPTRFMTLGSAYYFLQDRQAQITIGNYRDGFLVEFDGIHRYFGLVPEVEFAYLQGCY